jgi:hypothetical protein
MNKTTPFVEGTPRILGVFAHPGVDAIREADDGRLEVLARLEAGAFFLCLLQAFSFHIK